LSDYRAPREWKFKNGSSDSSNHDEALLAETGLSALTLQVCLSRGLTTPQAIRDHLQPKFDQLHHPMSIKDMDKATARLARARAGQESIRVFGDYDVDGTTGAALLSWVFRDFGFRFDVRQPDRFKDGYGLNVGAVEEASAAGATVLLTVDCGITSFDAISRAGELGIEVIVVDHHQLDANRGLPAAHAVVNPQRPDCESGLKQLCGCGLAFYLAMALRIKGREEGWFVGKTEPNLKQHLDLVVMATAADMVPLTGDNHILVRHGMDVLKNTKKPGVRALLDAAGVGSKDLSPSHLGFVLGPRINASGRMQSASLALELLSTTDAARGTQLAHELERLNKERADLQNQIWDEVRGRVEAGIADGKYQHGIVVADPGWHEGVVGIVASRVTETFRRPAAVISIREDFAKGSVRTFGGKDVLGALRSSSQHLIGFGGHKHAAGLSLMPENLAAFEASFDEALSHVQEDTKGTPLLIEGECQISDLDAKTLQELESLGPFGPGNPEPVFSFKAWVQSHRVLKERHLKLMLEDAETGSSIEGIWFHAAQERDLESPEFSEESEWAGVPELNRFRGQATPNVRIRDWRPMNWAEAAQSAEHSIDHSVNHSITQATDQAMDQNMEVSRTSMESSNSISE
jgi:single-stranded-DNA-specific exonuclease